MHTLPQLLEKLLHQRPISAQGFEKEERNSSQEFKLLCAFASRWSGQPDYAQEANTPEGRAAVAETINKLLLQLPGEREELCIIQILQWLAEICKSNNIRENWFSEEFLALIEQASTYENTLATTKETVEIPPKRVEKVELLMKQEAQQEENDEAEDVNIVLPHSKKEYKFKDDTDSSFFKNTHNPLAMPINILENASQQAVSSGDSRFRNVHERQAIYEPKYTRDFQAPYCYSLEEVNAKMDLLQLLEVDKVGQKVRICQNQPQSLKNTLQQQAAVNDAMNDCQRKINQYNEGRMRQKALDEQEIESRRYSGRRTFHYREQCQYYYGQNNKKNTIFDEEQVNIAKDQGKIDAYDDILENGHDEDFTGLGLQNLNAMQLRTRAGVPAEDREQPAEDAAKDEYNYDSGQDQQKQKQAGYLYRKAVVSDLLEKESIPMFDKAIAPLPYQKDNSFKSAQDPKEIEQELLSGGPHKLDPRVYQVTRTASILTDNRDLELESDSEESTNNDVRGGLEDSENSEQPDFAESGHEVLAKSTVLKDYKEALMSIENCADPQLESSKLLQKLVKERQQTLAAEKQEFDLAEQKRSKEAKKQDLAFKPKKFVSETSKEMFNTKSGVSSTIQSLDVEEQHGCEQLSLEKQQANSLLMEINAEIEQLEAQENEYISNYDVTQRKTEAAEYLKIAAILKEKDSDAPKRILSALLFNKNYQIQNTEYPVLNEAFDMKQKVNYDLQEPNIYNQIPVRESLLRRKQFDVESLTEADEAGIELSRQTYAPAAAPSKLPGSSHNSVCYGSAEPFTAEFRPKTHLEVKSTPDIDGISILCDQKCEQSKVTENEMNTEHFIQEQQQLLGNKNQQLMGDIIDPKFKTSSIVFENEPSYRKESIKEQTAKYKNFNPELFVKNIVQQNQVVPSIDSINYNENIRQEENVNQQLKKYGIRVTGSRCKAWENQPYLQAFCGVKSSVGPGTAPRVVPKKGKKGKKGSKAKK